MCADDYGRRAQRWYFKRRFRLYRYTTDLNEPPLGDFKARWPRVEPNKGGYQALIPSWQKLWQRGSSRAADAFLDRPTFDPSLFTYVAVVVGVIVALSIGSETPRMVSAADIVTFDVSIPCRVRSVVLRRVRAHARAGGAKQHSAAAPIAIQSEITTEIANTLQLISRLPRDGNHEPATWEGV